MRWRPTAFSCLVAETLIAFFKNCNISPVEAEKKMLDWGARPVRVCNKYFCFILQASHLIFNGSTTVISLLIYLYLYCWAIQWVVYSDQYQYLGNCITTPPLTQHVIIS